MAEEYFYYVAGSDFKPVADAKSTYNGDVTEQDLRCWALSSKTCAVANTRALKAKYSSDVKWHKQVQVNKRFGIFTTDTKYYPPELCLDDSLFPDQDDIKLQQISCVHKPGKIHSLINNRYEKEPLCVSCPSCWSTLRKPYEPAALEIKKLTKTKQRKKLIKNCSSNIKSGMMAKNVKMSSKGSPRTKTARNLCKAAVRQAKNTPMKLNLRIRRDVKKATLSKTPNKMIVRMDKQTQIHCNYKEDKRLNEVNTSKVASTSFQINEFELSGMTEDIILKKQDETSALSCPNQLERHQNKPKCTSRGRILKQRKRDY